MVIAAMVIGLTLGVLIYVGKVHSIMIRKGMR